MEPLVAPRFDGSSRRSAADGRRPWSFVCRNSNQEKILGQHSPPAPESPHHAHRDSSVSVPLTTFLRLPRNDRQNHPPPPVPKLSPFTSAPFPLINLSPLCYTSGALLLFYTLAQPSSIAAKPLGKFGRISFPISCGVLAASESHGPHPNNASS